MIYHNIKSQSNMFQVLPIIRDIPMGLLHLPYFTYHDAKFEYLDLICACIYSYFKSLMK